MIEVLLHEIASAANRVQQDGRDEACKDDANVGGGDPVLQSGTRIELMKRRSAFQSTEPDAVRAERRRL